VILLLDEIVGHVTEKIRVPGHGALEIVDRKPPARPPSEYLPFESTEDLVPPLAAFGTGYRFHVTGLLHHESGFPSNDSEVARKLLYRLRDKIEHHRDLVDTWEEEDTGDADLVIYAYGAVARSARSVVKRARAEGLRWGLFRPASIWPFLDAPLSALASRVRRIVVAEMNLGQLSGEVERVARGRCDVVPFNKVGGEPIHPDELYDFCAEGA